MRNNFLAIPSKYNRRYLFAVFILGTLLLVINPVPSLSSETPKTLKEYLGEPEYKKLDLSQPIYKQTRIVSVGKRVLKIPIVYISGGLSKGQEQSGINFSYVLPEFKSKADFKDRAAYKEAFGKQLFGGMLIEEASKRPSLDQIVTNRRRGIAKEASFKDSSGLEAYKWYYSTPKGYELYSEIYLKRDKTKAITDFIECDPLDRQGYPMCNHKFHDQSLLYYSYYNRKNFFASWKDLKIKAINFIDAFEVKK